MDLSQALLVSVNQIFREILQLLRHQRQCFLVVGRQLDLLPQVFGSVSSLSSLHVQVAHAVFLSDSGVARVRQRTRALDTQPSHIIHISAESSLLGHLALEGAELVVDHLPHDLVVLHVSCLPEKVSGRAQGGLTQRNKSEQKNERVSCSHTQIRGGYRSDGRYLMYPLLSGLSSSLLVQN